MRVIVCIFVFSFGQLQAQEVAKKGAQTPKAKQHQFSLDELKTVDVLTGREAIQNPQAAELWHMKEKADRLNGIAGTQEARDAIRRFTNRFTRQLQIAVNLPANERITNGKPAMIWRQQKSLFLGRLSSSTCFRIKTQLGNESSSRV
jgi:hypothetical protein